MLTKNSILKKNFLFNTVNLNKKKILKKNFSQFNIQKKFGNFYSGVYVNIYNNLFEKSIKKFYTQPNLQKLDNINKSNLKFFTYFKIISDNIIFILRILSFCFSKKKKLTPKKIIFQSLFDYSNQMSFWPVVKRLKKKEYYFLTKTFNYKNLNFYKKLYGFENVINIHEFYDFKNLFTALYLVVKDYKNILFLKKIFHISNIKFLKLFFTIYKNYYLYLIYSKIFKQIKQKKNVLMSSIGNEMLIAAIKDITKSNIISYAVQGVSFTAQSLTSQFLFNSVDKLFCYGPADYNHFKKISLNKDFIFPKQISIGGSVRDFYFNNKKKIQNNKNKLKILYLKSNSIWFGNLDGYYVNLFTKALETKFKNKFYYQIKERKNFISDDVKYLIKNAYINKKNVLIKKKMLTEKIIFDSDIIVGTISTSLIYQSLYYNKIIIQLGSNNFPWAKNLGYLGILCAKNENEIIRLLRNILFSPKYLQTIKKNQNFISKNLVSKRNAIKTILDHIDK